MTLRDTNPNHWYNREDWRLFVPKRYGYGWTLNFANRWTWLLSGAMVFALIGSLLNRGMRRRS